MASGDIIRLGGNTNYPNTAVPFIQPASAFSANTYVTFVDISGEGELYYAFVRANIASNAYTIKVIIDGATIFEGTANYISSYGYMAGIISSDTYAYNGGTYAISTLVPYDTGIGRFDIRNMVSTALPSPTTNINTSADTGEIATIFRPLQFKSRLQIQIKVKNAVGAGANSVFLHSGVHFK